MGATVSMFGYLGGMTLSMPRIVFALARDGFLPRALAAVHPVHRVAAGGDPGASTHTLALAVSGTFEKLAILANVSALALYLGCALASWRLRQADAAARTDPPRLSPGHVVPWLATVVILWLLSGMTGDEWLGFGVCLIAAALIYLVTPPPSASIAYRRPEL